MRVFHNPAQSADDAHRDSNPGAIYTLLTAPVPDIIMSQHPAGLTTRYGVCVLLLTERAPVVWARRHDQPNLSHSLTVLLIQRHY